MAYTQNTPLATQKINSSQPIILENFTLLNPAGNGYMEFLLKGTAPTFGASSNGMYTFLNTDTTKDELYVKKHSNDAPTTIPFTASKMSNSTMANSVNGWCYLPSGLLMKWGSKAVTTTSFDDVDFQTLSGGPPYTTVFQALVTAGNSGPYLASAAGRSTLTTTVVKVYLTAANASTSVSYLIIGV